MARKGKSDLRDTADDAASLGPVRVALARICRAKLGTPEWAGFGPPTSFSGPSG